MKKTHQNVPIYATFQGIFLKQLPATKEKLRAYQRKRKNYTKPENSNDKVINVQLLVQSDREVFLLR